MSIVSKLKFTMILVAFLCALVPFHPVFAATGTIAVNGGSTINLAQNATQSVAVSANLSETMPIGAAWNITITWDESVIRMDSVAAGYSGTTNPNSAPYAGSVIITASPASNLPASITLATLNFTAVGAGGSSTSINVSVTEFVDGNNIAIPITSINPCTVSILQQHTLTMAVSGQGTTNPSVGASNYNEGSIVNISANPATGWAFSNWTGDVANSNSQSTTVTMNTSKTVTAVFTQLDTYTLTMGAIGEGSVIPSAGSHAYFEGEVVNISASPASGWVFSHWEGDVTNAALANTSVTMNANKTVNAVFTRLPVLTMAVNGQGTITPAPGNYPHQPGDVVSITATPAEGWRFVNWTGGVANPSEASTTVTVNQDITVTAVFAPRDSFALTISITGEGTTSPEAGTHNYPLNEVVTITATPASGYKFDSWTGDVSNPTSATTTVTIDTDKQVAANFIEVDYYTLTLEVEGNGTTEPAPGVYNYSEGQTVSISALPADGYRFTGWTGNVADISRETTTILMDGDKTVKATFEEIPLPPVFLQIDVLVTTRTEAVIVWQTDKPATGEIVYWTDGGQARTITAGQELANRHGVLIEGLEPGEIYYFTVKAVDAFGNEAESPENSFTTAYNDARFIITKWESEIDEIEDGRQVTINLAITNIGDMPGGYEITLKVNGVIRESKAVTIEPQTTGNASITTLLEEPGYYTVDVNGYTVVIEVPEAKPVEPDKPGFAEWFKGNWIIVLGVVAGIALLTIIGIIILRRYFYIVTFVRR